MIFRPLNSEVCLLEVSSCTGQPVQPLSSCLQYDLSFFFLFWHEFCHFACHFLAGSCSLHPSSAGLCPCLLQVHLSLPCSCKGPVLSYSPSINSATLSTLKQQALFRLLFGWTLSSVAYPAHLHIPCCLISQGPLNLKL